MSHHHGYVPIFLLFKLGKRWVAIGAILFLLFNPVTLGIVLALLDHFAFPGLGNWFFGWPQQ